MSEENQTPAQPVTGGEAAPVSDNDLNLSDLNAMKMIIDVASTRGAFKPTEMVLVGQTYNKSHRQKMPCCLQNIAGRCISRRYYSN